MSLTTQCPRCFTAFLVTPGQLREAQGWVRCGVCQEVFGAQAHALPAKDLTSDDAPMALRQEADLRGEPEAAAHGKAAPTEPTGAPGQRFKGRLGLLGVAVLVTSLLLQMLWHHRHRLATQLPTAAAWVQSACAADVCKLRNIADIAIEESYFSAPDPIHFRLSAVITNRSNVALESPALMLALTDSADRVIARRSYQPLQWGTGTMAAQTSWPVVLWVRFEPPADSVPVVGYRLKAFYP